MDVCFERVRNSSNVSALPSWKGLTLSSKLGGEGARLELWSITMPRQVSDASRGCYPVECTCCKFVQRCPHRGKCMIVMYERWKNYKKSRILVPLVVRLYLFRC